VHGLAVHGGGSQRAEPPAEARENPLAHLVGRAPRRPRLLRDVPLEVREQESVDAVPLLLRVTLLAVKPVAEPLVRDVPARAFPRRDPLRV